MNAEIALFLIQDGLTNGAIYALLALALVLVFAVTRVIFIPQGEFVSYGALTLASLQLGKLPGTAWLLLGASLAVAAVELVQALRLNAARAHPGHRSSDILSSLLRCYGLPGGPRRRSQRSHCRFC